MANHVKTYIKTCSQNAIICVTKCKESIETAIIYVAKSKFLNLLIAIIYAVIPAIMFVLKMKTVIIESNYLRFLF